MLWNSMLKVSDAVVIYKQHQQKIPNNKLLKGVG